MVLRSAALMSVLCFALPGELSAAEPQRQSLFNGKNLDGWVVTGCKAEVRSGVLFATAGNGLIRTANQYRDFTFELEWRALKKEKWDAGIYFRFSELPSHVRGQHATKPICSKARRATLMGFRPPRVQG
ncbi:MAG: DUF1080 domain-containing protein [Pirellulaceae bacterium]